MARIFEIEHFYFGNLILNGAPVGSPGILASTPGITLPQVQECLKYARISPPPLDQASNDLPSSIGLFRGETLEYIFLKSQRTKEGHPQLHYQIVPGIALRWLGGNYRFWEGLAKKDMPSFEQQHRNLPLLTLEDPQPLEDDFQVKLLYDLYFYCGDNVKNVEGLLAGLIQRQSIAIINAPPSLEKRMRFIHGMLCLLPAPARLGVTWAVSVEKVEDTRVQLKFLAAGNPPADHLVYDWLAGQMIGEPPQDKYSKFITSQLRLDASLVVENTTRMARTAVWRAMRKESLAQALHFASRRAAIDAAVLNNQPADREIIAEILQQDPTLPEDLALRYARHLLAFTLVLDTNIEHADVLPVVAATNRPVAESIYQQLRTAIEDEGRDLKVLQIVEHWLTSVPQATSLPWHRLGYIAIFKHLDELLKERDTQRINGFLQQIQALPSAMQLESVLPQIIDRIRASAVYDQELARGLFTLATRHMPLAGFQNLTTDPAFSQYLPPKLQYALTFLHPQPRANPPERLLVGAVSELEPENRMIVMSRLIEWAVTLERTELVDQRTLEGVVRAAQSGYAEQFDQLIQYFTKYYTSAKQLQSLSPTTLEMLPALYFTTGRHEAGVNLLQVYQSELFGLNRLPEFAEVAGRIFLGLKLPIETMQQIFALLEQSKLRSEPRAKIYCSMLIASDWNHAYRNPARRLSTLMNQEKELVETIGVENVMKLMEYLAANRDAVNVLECGQIMLDVALKNGEEGRRQMVKVWEHLNWDMQVASAGMALMRVYVRKADETVAHTLPAFFGRQLGENIGQKLQATYLFRQILGEDTDLLKYTEALRITSQLLYDMGSTYHENKDVPPPHRIRANLDAMVGHLTDDERSHIGANIDFIARHIFQLGTQRAQNRRTLERNEQLLLNQIPPETGLEMLIYLGGYFSGKKKFTPDLSREEMAHMFGVRGAQELLRESDAMEGLLNRLLQAFPPNSPPKIDLETLNEELENLWKQISLFNQRQCRPILAEDTQHIAALIPMMANRTKKSIFENKTLDTGSFQPQNELEALRWVSGYFNRTHKR